jgi:hypothetical protein
MDTLEERTLLTNYVVTTANDLLNDTTAGQVTLRDALTAIDTGATSGNALAGSAPYTISFAIGAPGSVATISLTSPLPALTVPAFIDGWSQSGPQYAGPPLIVLNGAGAGSGADGLEFGAGSQGSTVRGLDIQQFSDNGIEINGANNVLVTGNYLGAAANGTAAAGNLHDGVLIDGGAANNTIGGSAAGAGNVISANGNPTTTSGNGVEIAGSGTTGNIVLGNVIGVDKTGSTPLANVNDGILIDQGAAGNAIGGSAAGDANVIAGNLTGPPSGIVGSQGTIFSLSPATINGTIASFDVTLNYTDAAQYRMVYLGIDPRNSSSALTTNPNTGQPDYSAFNFIPSSTVSADWGPVANPFPGEFLLQTPPGTGGTPAGLLPNADYFVGTLTYDLSRFSITPSSSLFVSLEGTDTTVGGEKPGNSSTFRFVNPTFSVGAQPLVSGAVATSGVELSGSGTTGNQVVGNLIGVSKSGASVGHLTDGVHIDAGASQNIIGGTSLAAGNVIANNDTGILVSDSGTDGNTLVGNQIGAATAPNTVIGVLFENGASGNTLGGTVAGSANVVVHNGKGVVVGNSAADVTTVDDSILGNSIFANTVSAIELGNQGAIPNGANPRVYPNDGQNAPLIGAITLSSIAGSLNSVPSTSFRIEVFAQPANGSLGQTFLGFLNVLTNNAGTANFSLPIALPRGEVVTATATNLANGDTSEASPIGTQVVVLANPVITSTTAAQTVPVTVQVLTANGPPTTGKLAITLPGVAGTITVAVNGKAVIVVNVRVAPNIPEGQYTIEASLLNADGEIEGSGAGLLNLKRAAAAARRWTR